jgi:hypothetical protein
MGERRTRTADVCLAVLATAVQLLGLREGQAVRPPEALTGVSGGVLLSVAVLAQGMSLLWRRRRPVSVRAV